MKKEPKIVDDIVSDIMDWHYRTVDINFGVKEYAQNADDVINIVQCGLDTQKERLIKEVEGMKKELPAGDYVPKTEIEFVLISKKSGYNQALEDILRRLQSV